MPIESKLHAELTRRYAGYFFSKWTEAINTKMNDSRSNELKIGYGTRSSLQNNRVQSQKRTRKLIFLYSYWFGFYKLSKLNSPINEENNFNEIEHRHNYQIIVFDQILQNKIAIIIYFNILPNPTFALFGLQIDIVKQIATHVQCLEFPCTSWYIYFQFKFISFTNSFYLSYRFDFLLEH